MAVTQYIGARYVPIFADPAEWSSTKQYEPLTIVLHEGNSYTSRQFVPVGVDIDDTDYWAETGNYNAQVEAYRQEVLRLSDSMNKIFKVTSDVEGIDPSGATDSYAALQNLINTLPDNSTLVFEQGTYLLSQSLILKSKVSYDFNGSNVVLSAGACITTDSTLKVTTTIIDDYAARSNKIYLSTIDGISVDDILECKSSTQIINNSREYYKRGFVSRVTKVGSNYVEIEPACPYDIDDSGCTAKIYSSNTVKVSNISDMELNSANLENSYALKLFHCIDSSVSNCTIEHVFYGGICMMQCVDSIIRSCVAKYGNSNYLTNSYPLLTEECSRCTMRDCIGINSNWHGISNGGFISILYPSFINCTAIDTSDSHYGFDCHANTIGEYIENCYANGFAVSTPFIMNGCKSIANGNSVAALSTQGKQVVIEDTIIENCDLFAQGTFAIRFMNDGDLYGNIVIRNCKFNGAKNAFVQHANGGNISRILIDNCDPIAVSTETALIEAEFTELEIANCRWNIDTVNVFEALCKIKTFTNCIFTQASSSEKIAIRHYNQLRMSNCVFVCDTTHYFQVEQRGTSQTMTIIDNVYSSEPTIAFISGTIRGVVVIKNSQIFVEQSNFNRGSYIDVDSYDKNKFWRVINGTKYAITPNVTNGTLTFERV